MIYDVQSLKTIYSKYSNINQKVMLESRNGNLIKIKRGLYTDNIKIDSPIIANICCEPSYISFEYALSYYGIIPERVSIFTSASYGKKDNKVFNLKDASFEYRSIPNKVFHFGIFFMKNENNLNFKIATKEKALCDTLYSKYPVRSVKDIKIMLFEDLRIDEQELERLDFDFIKEIAPLYRSNTINSFIKYLKRYKKND